MKSLMFAFTWSQCGHIGVQKNITVALLVYQKDTLGPNDFAIFLSKKEIKWQMMYSVFTKLVNSNFCEFWLAPVTREYPWLFTVLRLELRWRLVSRHFRKTKQIPRKRRTLASRCLQVGRKSFSCWICNKILKMCLTKSPKCFKI